MNFRRLSLKGSDDQADLEAAADAAICSLFLTANGGSEYHRLTQQGSNSSLVIRPDSESRDEFLHQPSFVAASVDMEEKSLGNELGDGIEKSSKSDRTKNTPRSTSLDLATAIDRCGGDLELLHCVMDRFYLAQN